MDHNQVAALLGPAALKVWPDLPREAQERLFGAAVHDGVIGNSLVTFARPAPTRGLSYETHSM
jgi:hypothetical protein